MQDEFWFMVRIHYYNVFRTKPLGRKLETNKFIVGDFFSFQLFFILTNFIRVILLKMNVNIMNSFFNSRRIKSNS